LEFLWVRFIRRRFSMAEKLKGNCIIAQSGGPTAVINSSVYGVIEEAFKHNEIENIYGAVNGILGVLNAELADMRAEDKNELANLRHTPSSALGSCRKKLKSEDYDRILKIFKAYNIRYFFYNGGNDSMDTANQVNNMAKDAGYELRVIGVPKTIDNDLMGTDHCPGYGSVARFNAIAIRDAGGDTKAIYQPDRIKIYETMGRNTGWIAAASALAREDKGDIPHLIYLPERPINEERFLDDVQMVYDRIGYVFIAVSEGVVNEKGGPISASGSALDRDGFGHVQYGGAADYLCELIKRKLKIKARFDKPGTIQRVGQDRISKTDEEEAYLVGKYAVESAASGKSGYMVSLKRVSDSPYKCITELIRLEEAANKVKKVPDEFITMSGNDITEAFIYIRPLIGGALPSYAKLKRTVVGKKI
jgi:6-phosphofructokinase 1